MTDDLNAFRAELQSRIARLDRGEGIVLEGDESLDRFFDELEAEVLDEFSNDREGNDSIPCL